MSHDVYQQLCEYNLRTTLQGREQLGSSDTLQLRRTDDEVHSSEDGPWCDACDNSGMTLDFDCSVTAGWLEDVPSQGTALQVHTPAVPALRQVHAAVDTSRSWGDAAALRPAVQAPQPSSAAPELTGEGGCWIGGELWKSRGIIVPKGCLPLETYILQVK